MFSKQSVNIVHNDPSRTSKVVDFGTSRKHIVDFLLVLNSDPWSYFATFQKYQSFCTSKKPLFLYPSAIPAKISGCSLWSRPVTLGHAEKKAYANQP